MAVADFDLAVIGGGINGTAIARDAAGRGLAVLLLEQNDLASGTSSASTKLIHGGLRYLEHGWFRLVRQALTEREVMLRMAPHIVRPMRFVLPVEPGMRPMWMLRLGLLIYDHLGGRRILPARRRSHIVVRRLFEHDHGYIFQTRDARIVFALPYEQDFTLIGTTDRGFTGDPAEVRASADEIIYLCDVANQHFRVTIGPSDVVWSFAGVRSLYEDGSKRSQAVSRDYVLALDERAGAAPLLTVYGGKITTSRRLGEQALNRLSHILKCGPAWTRRSHLPGGEFPHDGFERLVANTLASRPFLNEQQSSRPLAALGP